MINRIDTIIKFKYTNCSLIPIVQNEPPRAGPDMVVEMMIMIEMMIEMTMTIITMMIYDNNDEDYTATNIKIQSNSI